MPSEFKEKYKAICRNPNSRQLSRNSGPKSALTPLWTLPFCSRPAKKFCVIFCLLQGKVHSPLTHLSTRNCLQKLPAHTMELQCQLRASALTHALRWRTYSGRRAPPGPGEGLTGLGSWPQDMPRGQLWSQQHPLRWAAERSEKPTLPALVEERHH